jgi:glycolate oxidase FAD binding subunit
MLDHPTEQPPSVPELGELIRRAAADGRAVYPVGGGTMLDYGLPPTKPGVAVDLRKLDQVIDYPARDMTITVQAGITVARLQAILRGEGQRLPVDVPQPERATIGGAVACNVSGPRRYGFGTLRDYVIGITVVNDQGQEVKAGGRVVKNVAGYDLCKLYTGSLGTLGVITQLTLKVRPLPEASTLVGLACPEAQLAPVLDRLHASRTRPACIEALSPAAAAEALLAVDRPEVPPGWLLLVGFEDNREAVAWQVDQLRRELSELPVCWVGVWADAAADPLWAWLANFPLTDLGRAGEAPAAPAGGSAGASPALAGSGRLSFKANLLPSAVADYCRAAELLAPSLQAHAGSGIVVGHFPREVTLDQAQAHVETLRTAAGAARGNLVLTRCPAEWKSTLGVWGQPRGDWWLMRAVKRQLDPHGLFNPGRFVDGI